MRVQITESANARCYYIVKSTYENGKRSNKVVERLGNYEELKKLHGDPDVWAKERAAELTRLEKEEKREVLVHFKPNEQIGMHEQQTYQAGYLFLQKIYHELGLDQICTEIASRHKFKYDLNSILSRLIYARILSPSSKLSTFEYSGNLLEQPKFDLHQEYRALDVLYQENNFIQAELYKNSAKAYGRNSKVLFYDCTNYFFEIEDESGLREYGKNKENRPLPIVEMGLFMDGDGLPLAFSIHSGSTNEQVTMKPLEEQILKDFGLSKIIVCTDSGLSSNANRIYNNARNRAFITTQSIKKLPEEKKNWALEQTKWRILGRDNRVYYDLDAILSSEEASCEFKDAVFYKEEWFKDTVSVAQDDNGKKKDVMLEQKMIVTFSLKYRAYQRSIRQRQIERAERKIRKGNVDKKKQNDVNRLISRVSTTETGEIADRTNYYLDQTVISEEEKYDGFYAVCTNLEDSPEKIIQINHNRWEIEESFRIMKSEFKARPVYVSNDERITAHFLTCYLALMVYRCLEKKLNNLFSCSSLIQTLRQMQMMHIKGEGYIPAYTRTEVTDALHEAFGFRTDYKIIPTASMKKIFRLTKKA